MKYKPVKSNLMKTISLSALFLALSIPVIVMAEQQVVASQAASAAEAPAEETKPKSIREMPAVVMVRVGDEEIAVTDFMKLISQRPQLVMSATSIDGKAEIVKGMITNRLFRIAMKNEGLLPKKPGAVDYQRGFLELSRKHFPPPPLPDEKAAYEYYEVHKQDYGIPAAVHLSQIQFLLSAKTDEQKRYEIRQRAEKALQRLRKGESFSELAKELTENKKASVSGGDLGFMPRKALPWLDKVLKGMKVGEHTGVVESPVGYEIFLLMDEREAVDTPFAKVREKVVERMRLESQAQTMARYVSTLVDEIGVEIVQKELAGAVP